MGLRPQLFLSCGLAILLLASSYVLPSYAQDHGEVGVFADYFRVQTVPLDLYGVGGRVSVNVHPHIALEGELAYDFDRGFGPTFTDTSANFTLHQNGLRAIHGMFGPKLQAGTGAFRAFITVKGGFVNFDVTNRNPGSAFPTGIENLSTNNVSATLYPGGGLEAYLGPIGLRLDVGDQIYFNNGANHNLMVTFGPHIRF